MNKLFRLISLAFPFVPTLSALAITVQPAPTIVSNLDDFFALICTASNLLFTIIIILSLIIFLYAAFLFLTGGGSEDNQKKARAFLLYGIIGIIVALLAKGMVLVVVNVVSSGSFTATSC